MREIKLYNVIFPIWFIMFYPPIILVTLAGNFIIDSLVLLASAYAFGLASADQTLGLIYKKTIWKVWGFGFLADFIGALFLFSLLLLEGVQVLPREAISAVAYNPFHNLSGLMLVIIAMFISSSIIFILNYKFTFKKHIASPAQRLKVCLAIAIVTTPWTFLIPTQWFYGGL
ncbi:hypothetical protein ACE3MS_23185 [Paenibacillus dendritiformis]|uniref:hypothetical protein n=1 Tax=Paenibacillus dendritiformis TaxID=130049 RepID=UPI003659D7DB